MVIQLLSYGADVNLPNRQGHSALHCAAMYGHWELLHILITHGADLYMQDSSGYTALYYACENGTTQTAEVLLLYMGDPDSLQNIYMQALHIAVENHNKQIVQRLIQLGANPFLVDDNGKSAFDLTEDPMLQAILLKKPYYSKKDRYCIIS